MRMYYICVLGVCLWTLEGFPTSVPKKSKKRYLTEYNSESSIVQVQAQAVIFFQHTSAGTILYLITAIISKPEKISLSEENRVSHLHIDKETAG